MAKLSITKIKFSLVLMTACAALYFFGAKYSVRAGNNDALVRLQPPAVSPDPPGQFSPSNARTADGKLIAVEDFIPAARCATCHKDSHEAWSESLHRNAGRAPFYKESVDILERQRGSEATQHCESCHLPVAVFSGALQKGSKASRHFDDEGVTCSVCHSITDVRLDGTGSYTIRRPALLAREDGTPIYGDVSDDAIMADVTAHRRAVMRPLLKTSEFCAACHKSVVTTELNGYKFLRGFSAYDEWQQSGRSHETVTPYYRSDKQVNCNSCHMPKVESLNDSSAKAGVVASHRWLGANTATPLFYKQTKQAQMTAEFLKAQVVTLDIFALKSGATGATTAPLNPKGQTRVALQPGEEVCVDVVVFNRKAAHSLPPELRDMYEPWIEFEAIDDTGKSVFHSGYLKPDGTLDERAHVYKAMLLDEASRLITRHAAEARDAKPRRADGGSDNQDCHDRRNNDRHTARINSVHT